MLRLLDQGEPAKTFENVYLCKVNLFQTHVIVWGEEFKDIFSGNLVSVVAELWPGSG